MKDDFVSVSLTIFRLFVAAVVVIGILRFVDGVIESSNTSYQNRFQSCIESGNQWISGNCIKCME